MLVVAFSAVMWCLMTPVSHDTPDVIVGLSNGGENAFCVLVRVTPEGDVDPRVDLENDCFHSPGGAGEWRPLTLLEDS